MKPPAVCASLIALTLAFILVFGKLSMSMTLVSAGAAVIVYSMTNSIQYATGSAILVLFTTAILMRYGVIKKEGFNVFTGPQDISRMIKKLKESFRGRMDDEEDFRNKGEDDEEEGFRTREDDEEEGFRTREDDEEEGFRTREDDEEEGFRNREDDEEEGFMSRRDDEEEFTDRRDDEEEGFTSMNIFKSLKEGFFNQVFKNISTAGYSRPGFGIGAPLLEGFEDQKKEAKKGKPAAVKQEMAMPFKLGEIPSQVKNGPHIDAGSTLIKAIQGLNPDQINAMTKDTKQLIETQKSLMGMLGTMKPMMNDGKELMETFQQMFGESAQV
jgi:low affinity Fe/Cu permease